MPHEASPEHVKMNESWKLIAASTPWLYHNLMGNGLVAVSDRSFARWTCLILSLFQPSCFVLGKCISFFQMQPMKASQYATVPRSRLLSENPAVNYATFCLLNLSPPEIWQRPRRNWMFKLSCGAKWSGGIYARGSEKRLEGVLRQARTQVYPGKSKLKARGGILSALCELSGKIDIFWLRNKNKHRLISDMSS